MMTMVTSKRTLSLILVAVLAAALSVPLSSDASAQEPSEGAAFTVFVGFEDVETGV